MKDEFENWKMKDVLAVKVCQYCKIRFNGFYCPNCDTLKDTGDGDGDDDEW